MRIGRLLGCLVALLLLTAPVAHGDEVTPVGIPTEPPASMSVPPLGFITTGNQALEITRSIPAVQRYVREHHRPLVNIQVYGRSFWQVEYAQENHFPSVTVNIGPDGHIMGVYTGMKAYDLMARGHYDPLMRHWWVWLPFGLLFIAPFLDFRNRRRLLHLDLAMILGFGISYALFEAAKPEASALWMYAPLLYLLGRLLHAGLRRRAAAGRGRLIPYFPTALLVVGVVGLFGARVALNLESTKVMDIGYASVVGADRIEHKQQLYVDNENHGDTYGPINYLAYVPFELALPWHGQWDRVWSAHAASITWDLLTAIGLFLLGTQFRAGPEGRRLGLGAAWAWLACPWTLLGLMENTNDGLVAVLLVATLLLLRNPLARGGTLGLAIATKFSPAALAVLIARGTGEGGRRAFAKSMAVCVGLFAFTMAMYWPKGGLHELWACTMGFQLSRTPDFSLWGVFTNIGWTQKVADVLCLGIIAVASFWPGRRTLPQVFALTGAILIAIQLPAGHWFFFYVMWFLPATLMAFFTPYVTPAAEAGRLGQDEADGDVVALPAAPDLALAS